MSLRIFSVHRRAAPAGADPDVVLVKEGFCWPALFIPLLWALYRRVWLGAFLYLALSIGLAGLGVGLGLGQMHEALLALGLNWIAALEANDWRRRVLAKLGYRETAAVVASTFQEAERRVFEEGLDAPPVAPAARPSAPLKPAAAMPTPFASPAQPGAPL